MIITSVIIFTSLRIGALWNYGDINDFMTFYGLCEFLAESVPVWMDPGSVMYSCCHTACLESTNKGVKSALEIRNTSTTTKT